MKSKIYSLLILWGLTVFTNHVWAQKSPSDTLLTRMTPFLSKTYFNFNFGGVYYPYSNANLNEGYVASGTKKNAFSGRFLLGYKFQEDFAVQFGVMRPATWFSYEDINYEGEESSVWVNLWSLSLKKNFKLFNKLDAYGEFGLGNFNRVGIVYNDQVIYDNAHYLTTVFGGGLQYQLTDEWDVLANVMYLPESKKHNQPHTLQLSLGATYNLQQVPEEQAKAYAADEKYFFPKRLLQLGYGTSSLGFFTNEFFSLQAKVGNMDSFGVPIFWRGDVEARNTISLAYQQTAFRTKKYFSLDWGASVTYFQTELNREDVVAVSLFPVLRFYLWRPKSFDFYIDYSVIGPAYVSKRDLDGFKSGPELTYQDFMGVGFFFGNKRQYNFDMRIMHYSNGNIFSENDGVAIPVVFSFGIPLK